MNENVIEWIARSKKASVTAAAGTSLNNKLLALAKDHPEVEIVATNKDGSIFAHVPTKWIKVSPPRQISEEQKAIARERLLSYRKSKEE